MKDGQRRAFWWLLLATHVCVVAGFWAWNHTARPEGELLAGDAAGLCIAFGRLAGLLAASAALLQILLVARCPWLGRAFALDRLTRVHGAVGSTLLACLLAHPLLLSFGYGLKAGASGPGQLGEFVRGGGAMAGALAALLTMLAAGAFTLTWVRRRLPFEFWRVTHFTLYAAVALAFAHQPAGSDFAANRLFAAYWWAVYGIVLAAVLLCRAVRPLRLYHRHRFTVTRVIPEAAGVTSVYIQGRDLPRLGAEGGQFVFARFLAGGFRWQAHPFSISAKPDGHALRLTIKGVGNYTRRIPELRPGTRVMLDGPHGLFTARRCGSDRVLLVAGGIGITPLRAMSDDLIAAGRDVVLLYANRTKADIALRGELDRITPSGSGRFRVIHVLTQDPAWDGERGPLDEERIRRLVPDASEREAFVCGPPAMMKVVERALRKAGVRRIHDERFSL